MGKDGHPYTFNRQLMTPPQSQDGEDDTRQPPVVKPPSPVPPEWKELNTKRLKDRRKKMAEQFSSGGTLKLPGPEILAKAKKHQDADWGLEKSVSTWPVDMSNVILKDKGIPAVLVHSIDTRYTSVPVTAIVERNVYAEAGRNIIIPAGSRLIGKAEGTSSSGQAKAQKVTITWERLIRPDGAAFSFNAASADAQGRGGVPAYLDEQFFKKYAQPFIMTAIEGLTMEATKVTEKESVAGSTTNTAGATSQSPGQQIRQMYIDNFKDIFDQLVAEASDVEPVLFVPSGTRLIAYPQADLWLRTVKDDEEQMKKEHPELDNPSVRKPEVDSWVDGRKNKNENENDEGESSSSDSSSGTTTPDTPPAPNPDTALDAGTPLYEPDDVLPDALLDKVIDNPVVNTPSQYSSAPPGGYM